MDTLLLSPSVPKRPCITATASSSSSSDVSMLSKSDQLDRFLETFIGLSDSPSSSVSLDLSLERLIESRASDADQNHLIESALKLGSALVESGRRLQRKRYTRHNSVCWVLPPDLTIKVFSMLDTQTLCHVTATCSMFHSCAMDSLCYSNIDLTSVVPKVNNSVVHRMVRKADKNLKSLKLGLLAVPFPSTVPSCPMAFTMRNSIDAGFSWNERRPRQGKESCVLTRSCLSSLSNDNGFSGAHLRQLHLYNIDRMDSNALCLALSSCPSLLDLEIVGLHIELRQTLETASRNCHSLERLFFESSRTGRDESLKSTTTCVDLVNGCPNMNSLALRGFKLQDYKVRVLLKGLRKLKAVDFSSSYSITGSFLRSLGCGTNGSLLQTLILRDCMHLKEDEVSRFLTAVLDGDFKFLRHVDISNREGLASNSDWDSRCYNTSEIIPMKRVLEERPEIRLVAEFPQEGSSSFVEMEQIMNSDFDSETSLASQISSHSSDVSLFMSSSDASYNSDQGSGNDNEEIHVGGYVAYDESSDEVDFLPVQ